MLSLFSAVNYSKSIIGAMMIKDVILMGPE
jgi:hypothetical protein